MYALVVLDRQVASREEASRRIGFVGRVGTVFVLDCELASRVVNAEVVVLVRGCGQAPCSLFLNDQLSTVREREKGEKGEKRAYSVSGIPGSWESIFSRLNRCVLGVLIAPHLVATQT